jgi:putative holliday junction resolvase
MAVRVLLGLDVGSVRIGVASARSDVAIPQPLKTLDYSEDVWQDIVAVMSEYQATDLVIGWPRNLQGEMTEQTRFVEHFVDNLRQHVAIPIHLQDEALTSHKAETELRARNKPYQKAEVDALAATFILEDYLQTQGMTHV